MRPETASGLTRDEVRALLLVALARAEPLEADRRRRLYEALLEYPGLHLAELARQAEVEEKLARYHIRVLVKSGLATKKREGNKNLYYPKVEAEIGSKEVIDRRDKEALALLRRPVPLRMVLALLDDDEGLTMGEMAEAAAVSRSTATYHVEKLKDAELVRVDVEGRARRVHLEDKDRIAELLTEYPPPKDIVSGFVEMWDGLEL